MQHDHKLMVFLLPGGGYIRDEEGVAIAVVSIKGYPGGRALRGRDYFPGGGGGGR